MIELLDIPINTNEELNMALQRIENILEPLKHYITIESSRKKDVIKNTKVLWLI